MTKKDRQAGMRNYKAKLDRQLEDKSFNTAMATNQKRMQIKRVRERKGIAKQIERAAVSMLGLGSKEASLGPSAPMVAERTFSQQEGTQSPSRQPKRREPRLVEVPSMPALLPPPPSLAAHRSGGQMIPAEFAPFGISSPARPTTATQRVRAVMRSLRCAGRGVHASLCVEKDLAQPAVHDVADLLRLLLVAAD